MLQDRVGVCQLRHQAVLIPTRAPDRIICVRLGI